MTGSMEGDLTYVIFAIDLFRWRNHLGTKVFTYTIQEDALSQFVVDGVLTSMGPEADAKVA